MKRILIAITLAISLCCSTSYAQEAETPFDPLKELWGVALKAIEFVASNGEPAYLYDIKAEESRGAMKLNLIRVGKEVVNIDTAVTADNLGEAPGLVGAVGVSLDTVLEKAFKVDEELPFEVTLGPFAGYDFGRDDWMYGPYVSVKVEFGE